MTPVRTHRWTSEKAERERNLGRTPNANLAHGSRLRRRIRPRPAGDRSMDAGTQGFLRGTCCETGRKASRLAITRADPTEDAQGCEREGSGSTFIDRFIVSGIDRTRRRRGTHGRGRLTRPGRAAALPIAIGGRRARDRGRRIRRDWLAYRIVVPALDGALPRSDRPGGGTGTV